MTMPLEIWSLFPKELVEIIVKYTNEEINQRLVNGLKLVNLSSQSYYCETDLKAFHRLFIFCLLYFGLQKDRHKNTMNMWKGNR